MFKAPSAASSMCLAVLLAGVPLLRPGNAMNAEPAPVKIRPPEPGLLLESKDPDRPKLWYAPVATEPIPGGARVWYQRVNTGETDYIDQRVLCVGEIRNGKWIRLKLGTNTPPWGGPDNICLRRSPHKPTWGGFNVFQIVRAESEYRMLYWDQPDEDSKAGAMLAFSPDGFRWTKQPGTVFTEYNDAFTLLGKNGEYLLYQTALEDWPEKPYPDNLDKRRRIITLRRSEDLRTWTAQEPLLRPDGKDKPETEFYLLKVFALGPGYAGLLMNYFGDPNLRGKHSAITHTELIVSRDGLRWLRPFRSTQLGFWSYADPVMLQGRLHFVTWDNGAMRTVSWDAAWFDELIADSLRTEKMRNP